MKWAVVRVARYGSLHRLASLWQTRQRSESPFISTIWTSERVYAGLWVVELVGSEEWGVGSRMFCTTLKAFIVRSCGGEMIMTPTGKAIF